MWCASSVQQSMTEDIIEAVPVSAHGKQSSQYGDGLFNTSLDHSPDRLVPMQL